MGTTRSEKSCTNITDKRFAGVKTDPRFRTLRRKKKRSQPTVDSRFSSALEDPAFQERPQMAIDKYGRQNLSLLENPTEQTFNKSEAKGALNMQRMLGLCPSDSESESSLGSLSEEDNGKEWGVGIWAANPDESVSETEATRRLAVVDMDWCKVSATALLAAFRSFVPQAPDSVQRVTVYLSDYGMERLPKEARQGPSALGILKPISSDAKDESDEEFVNQEELRQYEKSKLRYYYAVVECVSVSVAEKLMQELDGTEFEASRCTFDIRYIPDHESFGDRSVRDAAESVPADFEGPEFECNALQKTNVKLSWDEDDDRRLKVVRRKFTEEELQNQDFSAYMASESDIDSDEEHGAPDYAALLKDLNTEPNPRKGSKAMRQEENSTDVSETEPEDCLASTLVVDRRKKVQKDGKKIWDKYEKRRNEKIKQQRRRGQFKVDGSASDSDSGLTSISEDDADGLLIEMPEEEKDMWMTLPDSPNEKSVLEQTATDPTELKKMESNMELLMMDDHMLHGARMGKPVENTEVEEFRTRGKKRLSRRARVKQGIAKKKQRSGAKEECDLTNFKLNIDDPRFEELLQSTDFAIDPTDPAFKRTSGAETVLQHVQQKTRSQSFHGKHVSS